MKKYYGQFQPPFDKILEEEYLGDIYNGIGLECGAHDGVTENNLKFFEDNYNWTIYNIEASPIPYQNLIKNRPKSHNFNYGLSNIDGSMIFTNAVHPDLGETGFGNGSLSHKSEHLNQLKNMGCSFKEYIIETKTFKSFCFDNNIKNIDCFILDVEGHEIEVLDGMKDCKILPKLLMIEYPMIGLDVLKNKINEIFPDTYKFDNIYHNSVFFIIK